MRPFKIQTLSDRSYSRLGDPIVVSTVITAGASLLGQLFPNIFGGTRKRLNDQDWLQLIPGNGLWTTRLRNYLKAIIKYDTDLTKIVAGTGETNLQVFTRYFAYENKIALGLGSYPNNKTIEPPFFDILKKEASGIPSSNVPGYISGTGFSIPTEWLLIGAGVLVLVMAKKKRRRK
jgi:hypothetical protein